MGFKAVFKKACNHVNDIYHDYTLTPKKDWEIQKLRKQLEEEKAKNRFPHVSIAKKLR
jgi:hypothetical protein|nr:MAG TPA: actin cytoskeleton-regulatory complex protein [Bacteriophage sp.]